MRPVLLFLAFALSAGCGGGISHVDDGDGDSGDSASGGSFEGTGGDLDTWSGGDTGSGGALESSGGSSSGGSLEPGVGGNSTETGGHGSGGAMPTGGSSSGGAPLDPDSDGDSVPDSSDQCPGGDDTQDLNENGEIDECEPGWCRHDGDPEQSVCGYGARQWYCTMEFDISPPGYEPGECIKCPAYNYDCNDDWSDGCETYTTGAHPCLP